MFQTGSYGTVTTSVFNSSSLFAYLSADTANIVVSLNNFTNSTIDNYNASLLLQAQKNWWGAAEFAALVGSGGPFLGNKNVDFSSYLNAPYPYGTPVNANILIGGALTENTMLGPDQTYFVAGSITIPSGLTLTLLQGTELRYFANNFITVDGAIDLQGTKLEPVIIRSGKSVPSFQDWGGIIINASAVNTVIDNAVIDNARPAIKINDNAQAEIRNSTLQNNYQAVEVLPNASAVIVDSAILSNSTIGIEYNQASTGSITGSVVSGNQTGIWLQGNSGPGGNPGVTINGNDIYDNTTNLLASSFDPATFTSSSVDATGNYWGSTDISLIKSRIVDRTNDLSGSNSNSPFVDYTGFLDSPIPTGLPAIDPAVTLYTIFQDTVLSEGTTYYALGDIYVPQGKSLTIPKNTSLVFNGFNNGLLIDGSLFVSGTNNEPVILSSSKSVPVKGDWQGVVIGDTAAGTVLNNLIIEYADIGILINNNSLASIDSSKIVNSKYGIKVNIGGTVTVTSSDLFQNDYGIWFDPDSGGSVTGSQISSNTYGLYVLGNGISNPDPVVNGNNIDNNFINYQATNFVSQSIPYAELNANGNWWGYDDPYFIALSIYDNADAIYSPVVDFSNHLDGPIPEGVAVSTMQLIGELSGATILNSGMIYEVVGNVTVPQGATLTIQSGVTLRFINSAGITVDGDLIVQGTALDPVVFTSINSSPRKGDWSGILINSASANTQVDHAVIEYAEDGLYFHNSSGSVTNSLIQYNTNGITINGTSSPIIDGNTIIYNSNGILIIGTGNDATNPNPSITNNDIYLNTGKQMYVSNLGFGTTVINAVGNWWGTPVPQAAYEIFFQSSATSTVDFSSPQPDALHGPAVSSLAISERYISPNGDGVQESTLITASLSVSSNWTISVKDESGIEVYNTSGVGASINHNWGTLVPDGIYSIVITASTSAGNAFPRSIAITVDASQPDASFDAALDGTTFSNVYTADIIGTASDANINNYKLEYGVGSSPTVWTQFGPVHNYSRTAVTLETWEFGLQSPLASGTYSLRLTVVDKAGNQNTDQATVTLGYLSINTVSIVPSVISPTDGEMANINFTIDQPADVTVNIYTESEPFRVGDLLINGTAPGNTLVRSIPVNYAAAGPKTIQWNGKDNIANDLPDEAYRVEIIATNAGGSTKYAPAIPDNLENTTDGTVTYLRMDGTNSPSPVFNTYKNEYIKYGITVNSGKILRGRTFMGLWGSDFITTNIILEEGSHVVLWDGRDQFGNIRGDQFLYPTASALLHDLAPASIVIKNNSPKLSGIYETPNIEIKANPYQVVHSYDQLAQVDFVIDQDSYVTIKLLPPCDNSPYTCTVDASSLEALPVYNSSGLLFENLLLQAKDTGNNPINHSFVWSGYDIQSASPDTNNILTVKEGSYTYLITATSANTGIKSQYRGVLQLFE
jgi:hypothetical protein